MRIPPRKRLPFLPKLSDLTLKHSNLPERYVNRVMRKIEYVTPKGPQYRQVYREKQVYRFGLDRPWTMPFQKDNDFSITNRVPLIEPIGEWCYFVGDKVEILVGKDKGKQGHINYIVAEENLVTVKDLNLEYTYEDDYVSSIEAPLRLKTEVALVDPKDNISTPVEWRYTDSGERVRVSTRSGRVIPIPTQAEATVDFKTPDIYEEQEKDTRTDDVLKKTYEPSLSTFAMDLMKKYDIKEDRVPKPTYWYNVEI